jgi:phosphoribosylformylglycinamidine (FGAM) synthase-like enzyme
VTGLVAQQQCVGPLQLPLSNVAVLSQSHFTHAGIAVAVGEQPIKGKIFMMKAFGTNTPPPEVAKNARVCVGQHTAMFQMTTLQQRPL